MSYQQGNDLVNYHVPILENICSYFREDELTWRDVYITEQINVYSMISILYK